jgi:thymidine kinase
MTLNVFVGPMFAGKTTKMVHELERQANINNGVSLYITHSSDEERSNEMGCSSVVTSHSHSTVKGSIYNDSLVHKIRASNLSSLTDKFISRYTAIGIDEGQFFNDHDLVSSIKKWLDYYSPSSSSERYEQRFGNIKVIYVSGIDGDGSQNLFPNSGIHLLLPIAEKFEKLTTAVCKRCIQKGHGPTLASFTIRRNDAPPGNIGGVERYEAVCRKCKLC